MGVWWYASEARLALSAGEEPSRVRVRCTALAAAGGRQFRLGSVGGKEESTQLVCLTWAWSVVAERRAWRS